MFESLVKEHTGLTVEDVRKMTPKERRVHVRTHSSNKPFQISSVDNGIHTRGNVLGAMGRIISSSYPMDYHFSHQKRS